MRKKRDNRRLSTSAAAIGRAKALQRNAKPTSNAETAWQPWLHRDARVKLLDAELNPNINIDKDTEVTLRVERATLLAQLGRNLEARTDYLRVIELEPSHLENLLGLGKLLVATGKRKAAEMVYAEAVKYHPYDVVCRVNLGSVLLEGGNPAQARMHYEEALRMDPDLPQAHGGMYYALMQLGEPEAAKMHQRKSFGKNSLFVNPYRGASQPVPVVLLVSSTGGGTPIEKLIDDRIFETYVVVADFYDKKKPLPAHKLVVNGIGDIDVAMEALDAAESMLAFTSAPVLNLPAAVRATGRSENAARLGRLPGVIAPKTSIFPRALLASPDGLAALAASGFTFPLLFRVPGFHMGMHFVKVDSPVALTSAVTPLPGFGNPEAEVLAIEYLDARGAGGCARKYRVMMVGGELYPLHLAISEDWKIHYFSADMADRPDHRAEEAKFLADMPGVLGSKAMTALSSIQAALGLDYGGIDFALNQRGEVLLFEANATMVVEQPCEDELWDYRRAAVSRIHQAVQNLLIKSAGALSCALPVPDSVLALARV